MKLYKRFLVQAPKVLDDSYVSAAFDGVSAGLSIHDGEHTVALNFCVEEASGKLALNQTLLGLELAIAFLRKELDGGQNWTQLPRRLLSAVLSQRRTSSGCSPSDR